MGKTITQSAIASGRSHSLIHGVEESIARERKKTRNLVQKFKAFCEGQEKNKLGWTAVTMAGQAFLLVPLTLLAVYSNGNLFALWIPIILSSFAVAISNLASLPTKFLIPIFCTSVLLNFSVAILSFLL